MTPIRDRRLMLLIRLRLLNIPDDLLLKLRNLFSQRRRRRERLVCTSSCTNDGRATFERTISSSLWAFWLTSLELVDGSEDPGEFPSLWWKSWRKLEQSFEARSNAVLPSWSVKSKASPPCVRSNSKASWCPQAAATCRGVVPSAVATFTSLANFKR